MEDTRYEDEEEEEEVLDDFEEQGERREGGLDMAQASRYDQPGELEELEYSQDYNDDRNDDHADTHLEQAEERYEEDEENEEEETDDEEDNDDDNYNDDADENAQEKNTDNEIDGPKHMYENKFTKPILKLGKTTVSVGEARLYGLLDKDGNVKLDGKKGKENSRSKAEAKEALNALSRKKDSKQLRPPEAEDEDAKECRFKPQKSKEASRAMRNPSCGYDFVTRLDEKGGFMARNSGNTESKGVDNSESAKEDYEASLDKLQCPKCKKYQSFDEYIEKRRSCGPCKERYVKLNVANMNSWKQRQLQAERRKQERLRKIEEDFYGDVSFAPKLNKTAKSKQLSLTERTTKLMEKQKAEAREAKQAKEHERLMMEEKQRQQAAAARANRAAAKKEELESLKKGGKEKKSFNKTAPASGLPATQAPPKKKKNSKTANSFNKTTNNISEKFDMLLN